MASVYTAEDVFPANARPVPGSPHERYVADRLAEVGRWGTESFGATVTRHARSQPDADAFISMAGRMTWREYDAWSDQLASLLLSTGLDRGERVAVLHPDGPVVHAVFIAIEKAGLVVVGIGPRAAAAEVRHLLDVSGAVAIVTPPTHRDTDMRDLVARLRDEGLPLRHHVTVEPGLPPEFALDGEAPDGPTGDDLTELITRRMRTVGEIWLINSTSGTTGLPKCVVHNQNRWIYYHELTTDAGGFTPEDRFMGLIPAPFGFGVWTAHTSPLLLGSPTVVLERFTADDAIRLIERESVSVLSCVSTQFIMMLNSPAMEDHDVTSLRCMFTGGEAVPYSRSSEFEERTGGAQVLQFYGSNETGALSYTTHRDSRERRLETAGRIIDAMDVALLDDDGNDVISQGGPGQAACAGPATCLGYYADDEANAALFDSDGRMLTGDICTVDEDGYLAVVGRKSDFIIRGGKNISAAAVEESVQSHPAVGVAAAVAYPDDVYGERVCVYVELVDGATLTLEELTAHLDEREISKTTWPERLEVVDEIPRSSGGKVAKGVLREKARSGGSGART